MEHSDWQARWQGLMQQMRLSDSLTTFAQLKSAYGEPHRFYHTADHIAACLREFDQVRDLAQVPAEVELALWFHDAVYDPRSQTNERDSAQWANQFLKQASDRLTVDPERVYDHILATAHLTSASDVSSECAGGDSALVVNIDLTILGQPPAVYDRFEANIRREYQHVPVALYRQKRREVLAHFLDQPEIFSIAYFRERYEQVARRNLGVAIATLS